MQVIPVSEVRRGFGSTMRRDAWWVTPAVVFVGLSIFLVYATWAAFQNAHYTYGPYLSPFDAPEIFGDSPHAWFGPRPDWWPGWVPFSPALIILPFPGLFRVTCYYYRGAYYKAFWADPPACTVGEPRTRYRGEQTFPLVLQNVHRYFLWIALVFLVLLAWDVWKAVWFVDPATGLTSFGIGLGTIVLAVNVVLLTGYTFGCHALRHAVGGRLDEMSKAPICASAYGCATWFNGRHQWWAWASLVSVMSADIYVRLCSMGILTDPRLL